MKLTDLKEAVQEIEFGEEKQEELIRGLKAGKRRGVQSGGLRIAAAFAVCLLAAGLLSVPVRAVVKSLVRERMEELPQERVAQIAEEVQSQTVAADSTTRDYTEEEKERRGALYQEYMQGRFPEGEIARVDSEEEAKRHEFCFLTTSSTFYLPADRALTDEEILEKIDFEKKRDYALQEQRADEIAEKEAAEREQVKEVVASGGISEEEAIERAKAYLERLFGRSGDGMELNHYFNDAEAEAMGRENTYCVNWSDVGNYQHYYFFIDAADGSLRSMSYSHGLREAVRPAASEAAEMTDSVKEQARNFLREKLEIQENIAEEKVYYLYNTDSGNVSRLVDVLFVAEDGTAYRVGCRWDGEVYEYAVTTKEACEERMKATAEANERYYLEEQEKEVTIEIIEQ
ncbi:MAG: hypothetical protein NC302_12900 [Bacteroidales bacterium]|nr:hypothetical protein [Bacteroidales bacterium]MCM1415546.1 hypothetical protein [bacterium]MCM1424379.1 hypothetical protein [bacterium]